MTMRLTLTLGMLSIFFLCLLPNRSEAYGVIRTRAGLEPYCNRPEVVMVASTGRSGSKMLTLQLDKYLAPTKKVVKTHILPPSKICFTGKIIFIFSNPDKAAESVLFQILHQAGFGDEHFVHVETADRKWLKKIGTPCNQTEEDNLLSYDAFGTYEHLKVWLYERTKPTAPEKAQILAIKYEYLWDKTTVEAIRTFLNLPHFKLPKWEERGHADLFPQELVFRNLYNLGTEEEPRYAAYDEARVLWEQAPPIQYLKIIR